MPIFSLPSNYGIGDFGKTSYKFVDFLETSGQKFWQILPLVQTGLGNSPYSSVCSESFNPYFISIEDLKDNGLLTKEEISYSLSDSQNIDYGFLYNVRYPLLKKAFSRFDQNDKDFVDFINAGEYRDYALFMSLKYAFGQKHFYEWSEKYKKRDAKTLVNFENDYKEEVLFWQFTQFIAKKQWLKLKAYANKKGIAIIGDMPLYVALDSVDTWTNPQLFKLDDEYTPTKVAGVPPDYFCEDGQLWGNPVYDYAVHQKDGFSWWKARVQKALSIYDYVRIDHFRGLDRYFEIEAGALTARQGEWINVPSDELFNALHIVIDKSRIIAEDLGIIDDGVRELLKKTGYPGMKILSFAFNGEKDNLYLPERLPENSVCYTGTHDNDTLLGLIENANEWDKNNLFNGVKNSLNELKIPLEITCEKGLVDAIIELGFASKANLFLLPMQDLLSVGSSMRINEPGTVKEQNWAVKFNEKDFSDSVAQRLKFLTKNYNR